MRKVQPSQGRELAINVQGISIGIMKFTLACRIVRLTQDGPQTGKPGARKLDDARHTADTCTRTNFAGKKSFQGQRLVGIQYSVAGNAKHLRQQTGGGQPAFCGKLSLKDCLPQAAVQLTMQRLSRRSVHRELRQKRLGYTLQSGTPDQRKWLFS
jgi:hypothetical protein